MSVRKTGWLALLICLALADIPEGRGQEPAGSIAISVRDAITGHSLAAQVTISQVYPDGSEVRTVETFVTPRYQTVIKQYPPGNYRIDEVLDG